MDLKELKLRIATGEKIFWKREFKNLYSRLNDMHTRCYNAKCKDYKAYGGRGIRVCKAWNRDKVGMDTACRNFVLWALKNGYENGLTIERINVHGWYSPKNCCWISQRAQYTNKQKPKMSEYTGVYPTIRGKKWEASIRVKGKTIHLGCYDLEIDAALAYDTFVIANGLNRELNFPDMAMVSC